MQVVGGRHALRRLRACHPTRNPGCDSSPTTVPSSPFRPPLSMVRRQFAWRPWRRSGQSNRVLSAYDRPWPSLATGTRQRKQRSWRIKGLFVRRWPARVKWIALRRHTHRALQRIWDAQRISTGRNAIAQARARRVAAAFRPAAWRFRVSAALRPACLRLRVSAAFFPA